MNGFRLGIISQRLSKIFSSKDLITSEIYRFEILEKLIWPIIAPFRRLPFGDSSCWSRQNNASRLRPLLGDRVPIISVTRCPNREITVHEVACPAGYFPMLKHVTFTRVNRTHHRTNRTQILPRCVSLALLRVYKIWAQETLQILSYSKKSVLKVENFGGISF
jgi:hypothetical protein